MLSLSDGTKFFGHVLILFRALSENDDLFAKWPITDFVRVVRFNEDFVSRPLTETTKDS